VTRWRWPLAFVLPAMALAVAPAHAEPVVCPAGLEPQAQVADFEEAIAAYRNQASDIIPSGDRPARIALKKAARTPGFPRTGRGVAFLLIDEQGLVQRVVVTCATGAALVGPVESALRDARPGRATRDGVPVKAAVFVEFGLGG
jgi:hypothetical protein